MEGNWKKSSYSQGGDANCVELAPGEQGLLIRDSKAPLSGTLSFAGASAPAFLAAVKAGLYQR
jgi:hypothetical protein